MKMMKFGFLLLAAVCLLFGTCDVTAIVNPDIVPDDPPENFSGDNGTLADGYVDWNNYEDRIITIDTRIKYQITEGFGAADAWVGALVGKMWEDPIKQKIADLLFSREDDSLGHPKGIGLSMWRVNLGAGTWELGDASKMGMDGTWVPGQTKWNHTRRSESYLKNVNNPSEGYDWTKCNGHQYWMREAKKRGTELFTACCFSPVVAWTKNGLGYGDANDTNRMSGNLTEAGYDAFPAYLADVADYFAVQTVDGPTIWEKNGKTPYNDPDLVHSKSLRLDFISPVNEPQFSWIGTGQEGSSFSNENIARLSRKINDAINDGSRPNINSGNTKILITEAGSWTSGFGNSGAPHADYQMDHFFKSGYSGNFLGDIPSMARVFAGHTYWTHDTDSMMVNTRTTLSNKAKELNINAWNTEWCGLRLGEEVPNKDNASFYDIGMFVAKLIHADMAIGNTTSWSFWTSMDAEYNLKCLYDLISVSPGTPQFDRFSMRSGTTGTAYLESSGSIKAQATLWALGHFSLFVRPGFQRIDISSNHFGTSAPPNTAGSTVFNGTKGLMATAYKSPPGFVDPVDGRVDRIVVVYVNWLPSGPTVAVKFVDDEHPNGKEPIRMRCYQTTERNCNTEMDLGRMGLRRQHHENGAYTIRGKSMYTVVYDFAVDE